MHTSKSNEGPATGEDAKSADVALRHGVLDGGQEETRAETDHGRLGRLV